MPILFYTSQDQISRGLVPAMSLPAGSETPPYFCRVSRPLGPPQRSESMSYQISQSLMRGSGTSQDLIRRGLRPYGMRYPRVSAQPPFQVSRLGRAFTKSFENLLRSLETLILYIIKLHVLRVLSKA